MKECDDAHCAVHKKIATRGREFTGTVISAKAHKTITVEWERRKYLPKYERYERRRTRIKAHAPECMQITKGDIVKIKETKPISKTKKFAAIEKMQKNISYLGKEEYLTASQKREKEEGEAQ